MPNFNLAPLDPNNLDPVWPVRTPRRPTKAEMQRADEERAGSVPLFGGILKPTQQFLNVVSSPDLKAGMVTGPFNAISKLTNSIGDWIQGKPIDAGDAWQITPQQARRYNPFRFGVFQEVTPADDAALQLGGVITAEVAGAALTGGVGTLLRRAPQVVRLANLLKGTAAVRRLAVAQRVNPALRTGLGLANNAGQALVGTTAAALFMDASQGNVVDAIGDLKGLKGLKLPGRTDPNANYLQQLGNNVLVDGIATPLALIGAGSMIGPLRRWMAGDGIRALDEIAEVELAPYMGTRPPIGAERQLPATGQSRGAWRANQAENDRWWQQGADPATSPWGAEWDSAISRSQAEQTQIRQVQQQRQWLVDQGLVQEGPSGQLQLNLGDAVDPEARLMIRNLQMQRGLLLRQMSEQPELAAELEKQLAKVDQNITELQSSPRSGLQQELDLDGVTPEVDDIPDAPDPRPELDTFLAHLDELGDSQLRDIYSRVRKDGAAQRNQADLEQAQAQVQEIQDRLQVIQQRQAAGEITPRGAQRLTAKAQAQLATAQQELTTIQMRMQEPLSLVGDQLALYLPTRVPAEAPDFQRTLRDLQSLPPPRRQPPPEPPPIDEARLAPVRELLTQRRLMGNFAEDIDYDLRAARAAKVDQAQIDGLQAQQRNMRATLEQLDAEIQAAQSGLAPHELQALQPPQWGAASEFGYRTPDDYRNALEGWNRDQLRRLSMPNSSPEVAALVMARTGRRVWSAKKSDIIDALVELAQRNGRFLPPEPPGPEVATQLGMPLRVNTPQDPALPPSAVPDMPADLSAPGMTRLVDADGNEVLAPAGPFRPRGMDPETRQQIKREILQAAIDNGEVQAPITPLPVRPQVEEFNQGSLVDQLLSDPRGQLSLLYTADQVPTYKAGGRSAEALIEEMRLRFEYKLLDAAAARAQREAFLESKGWSQMTWQEKKASGLLDPGQYSLTKQELSVAREEGLSSAGVLPDAAPDAAPAADGLRRPNPPQPQAPSASVEWTPEGPKPIDPPAASNDAAGLAQGFAGLGNGAGATMRRQLFDAFQAGKTTVSGVKDPVLAAARQAGLDPMTVDEAAFNRFIDQYAVATSKGTQPPQGPKPVDPAAPPAPKLSKAEQRQAAREARAKQIQADLDEKRARAQTERLRKERERLEQQLSEGSCNG